jgi:putative transposase
MAYPLSSQQFEEAMAGRDVSVDHSTVHRRDLKMLPALEKAFRHRKRPVGKSGCVDETYIKVKVQWKFVYRTVDKAGKTIDILLCAHRDKVAVQQYFEKYIAQNRERRTVTTDKNDANPAALGAISAERETSNKICRTKHPNDIIEQDPHAIKRHTRPVLGFNRFRCTHSAWWHRDGTHDCQETVERQRRPTDSRRAVLLVGEIRSP